MGFWENCACAAYIYILFGRNEAWDTIKLVSEVDIILCEFQFDEEHNHCNLYDHESAVESERGW